MDVDYEGLKRDLQRLYESLKEANKRVAAFLHDLQRVQEQAEMLGLFEPTMRLNIIFTLIDAELSRQLNLTRDLSALISLLDLLGEQEEQGGDE